MPIVKHVCVHYNAKRTLRYVLDPAKTDDLLWATSINCMTEPDLAYTQMAAVYEQFARDHFNSPPPLVGNGTVKVIHYIQSFSPDDNVTPELAHRIAKAFVRYSFGDDAQAVIATHVDKGHIHSHIVLNSYSLSGQKFYANKASLRRLREISDGVSQQFGVKKNPKLTGKGKSIAYNEWQHKKNGTSWKQQIRDEIDKLIGEVTSLDELLQLLEERGYEVKRGKYISIRATGQERFVRTKTLGDEYTEDSLNIRIRYRVVGAADVRSEDNVSKLQAAYVEIIGDVRILVAQRKKVPRKRIVTAEYSVENNLDVYKLSVINQEHIGSIGELEGRIARLRAEYEKLRGSEQNEKLLQIRQRYDVYCDIVKTYGEISKPDYISGLVEEERQRQEQMKKKRSR